MSERVKSTRQRFSLFSDMHDYIFFTSIAHIVKSVRKTSDWLHILLSLVIYVSKSFCVFFSYI